MGNNRSSFFQSKQEENVNITLAGVAVTFGASFLFSIPLTYATFIGIAAMALLQGYYAIKNNLEDQWRRDVETSREAQTP